MQYSRTQLCDMFKLRAELGYIERLIHLSHPLFHEYSTAIQGMSETVNDWNEIEQVRDGGKEGGREKTRIGALHFS